MLNLPYANHNIEDSHRCHISNFERLKKLDM